MADTRERIIEAAAKLVAEGGIEAASTRAITAAAGVQAPTLYRLFGDKQGLLDAVAAHGFATYLVSKQAQLQTDDELADVGAGFDLHVEFGVANPGLYVLMYGAVRPGHAQPAEGRRILRAMLERAAAAGRLRVPVETALEFVGTAGVGITLQLIATPPEERDLDVARRVRDRVLAAISAGGDGDGDGPAVHAVALQAALRERPELLGEAETALMVQWLGRIADA
jgi:AcrR family transcriptional regulator